LICPDFGDLVFSVNENNGRVQQTPTVAKVISER